MSVYQRSQAVAAGGRPLPLARFRTFSVPLPTSLLPWLSLFAVYVAVASVLVFQRNLLVGDALSRVGIALRILYSRDPHLAAVGFIWSPLPPLSLLPLMPLKALWPELVTVGFASNLVSALFMTGAVYQLSRMLKDMGLNRFARIGLTASFALHPLILFSAVNGMTEAPALFFLLLAARQLTLWVESMETGPKVYCGIWLAVAYLTRYDAAAAAAAACAVVAVVSVVRTRGAWKSRIYTALSDAFLLGAPFAYIFIIWALASWLIVGHPFEQLTSVYGTAAQLRVGAAATGISPRAAEMLAKASLAVLSMYVFLVPFAALGLIRSWRRRDARPVAVLAVFGAVLAFMVASYVTGAILPSLRYLIIAVPLGTLMAGYALGKDKLEVPTRKAKGRTAVYVHRFATAALTALVLALAMLTLPVAMVGLLDPRIDPDEAIALQGALNPGQLTDGQRRATERFVNDRQIAGYLDSRHLPRGAVLLDVFLGYAIVLASEHPDQFVITSDRDFKNLLADPAGSGVRYILVPTTGNLGSLDAVNTAYPQMYAQGAGIGVLDQTFPDNSDFKDDWRLYRVIGSH